MSCHRGMVPCLNHAEPALEDLIKWTCLSRDPEVCRGGAPVPARRSL